MTEFEKLCNEYRENKRLGEELDKLNKELQKQIIALMNGLQEMQQGAAKATYKPAKHSTFDKKAFEKDFPGVYDNYTTATQYMRFSVR